MTSKQCRLNLPIVFGLVFLLTAASAPAAAPKNARRVATVLSSDFGASPAGQTATPLPDGNWLLLGGLGDNGGPTNAAALRDAATGAVTPLSSPLQWARAWHTATVLPDGSVLILGGIGSDGGVVTRAELFHPETQTFELVAKAPAPRAFHTSTLLTDGRIVIAGGVAADSKPVSALELWDFRKQTSTLAGSGLIASRRKHTATLLADGGVLFAGGEDNRGNALATTEVYDPQSNGVLEIGDSAALLPSGVGTAEVRATSPEDGATNVPLDAVISLRFSRMVLMPSINSQTLVMQGPDGDVPAKVVAAEGGMLAFITTQSSLAPGTTYNVKLSGAVDTSNTNVAFFQFKFTTAGPAVNPKPSSAGASSATPSAADWQSLPPLHAPPGATALAGQALTVDGAPLKHLTLQIDDKKALTDETGRFLLLDVTSGHHSMMILGPTANTRSASYGIFEVGVDIKAGQTNTLGYTIWMTPLDMAHAVTISSPTIGETVIRTPLLPGLELHIPANTVITGYDGKVVKQISITPIRLDRPPFPLPNVKVPVYFTIQPGSAYIKVLNASGPQGAQLYYPNMFHAPAGTVFDFWNYDPDQRGWYIYGTGRVAADGSQVIPAPGVVIYEFTGAMADSNPNDAPPTAPPPGSSRNGPGTNNDNPDSSPDDGSGGSDGSGSGDDQKSGPGKGEDGEPVDLSSGLFIYSHTDLYLPDVIPIVLTRTYRPGDSVSRAFGIGTTHGYDIFPIGETSTYSFMDMILADGGRVHFARTSPGTSYVGAVYTSTGTPTSYYGGTIAWNGNGWTLTKKNGSILQFREAFGAIVPQQAAATSITDRNGNTLTLTRDANSGNLNQITSPNGRWIQFTYDSHNRIIQAQDNIGRTVRYGYDAAGRLQQVTDVSGGITRYTYDSNNNMTSITDARNIVYLQNTYDANHRVTQQTMADGSTYSFSYAVDSNNNIAETEVSYPNGSQRIVDFNAAGYMTSETLAVGEPEQETITYNRDPATGLLLSAIDALSRKISYTYDAQGNIATVTVMGGTPQALTASATYDPTFSQPVTITDALGRTTQLQYDGAGNLISVIDPLQRQATFSYNSAGQLISSTGPMGNTVSRTYTAGDLASITDALGNTTTGFMDSAGRLISLTNALGRTWIYTYSPADEILQELDPQGHLTSFNYDPNGNLLSVTDARQQTTSYAYDSMDRLQSETDPLGHTNTYQYDAVGGGIQRTDQRGIITTTTFDNIYRKQSVSYGSDRITTYSYDSGSRFTGIADTSSGSITPQYDSFDRLISISAPQGAITYSYDAANRKTSMQVAGQPAVLYSYDNGDRLTQVTQTSSSVTFSFDALDRRTSLLLPNGITAQYGYDQGSRMTGITYGLGTSTLGNLTYTYDSVDHRNQAGGTFARSGLPQSVGSAVYDGANRLTQRNGTNLTYDASGNLTNDGINSYTWNARNELVSIGSAGFQYDAFGRRLQNGSGTQFLYDGANVVQELTGSTPTANLLTGGLDEIFSRTDATGSLYPLTDILGNTLALSDSTGTLSTQFTYDAFGNTSASGGSSTYQYQYTGRENDATGLYYFRGRYYSPGLQRFVNQDPVGFSGGINKYSYVLGNPIEAIDPWGLDVVVRIYTPADAPLANVPGHASVSINCGRAWGLGPTTGEGQAILHPNTNQPGEVYSAPVDRPLLQVPDYPNAPTYHGEEITIPTSPDQDRAMQQFVKNARQNPPPYRLHGHDCSNFVQEVLAAGGVNSGPPTSDPSALGQQLEKLYGSGNNPTCYLPGK